MRDLHISTGSSRLSTQWTNRSISWEELCGRLQTPARGVETIKEYLAMSKAEQAGLKDKGGFVGGYLSGPRRIKSAVAGRDIIALDMDDIPAGLTEGVIGRVEALGCAFAVYSTRKHRPEAPRLRAIIPLDRTVDVDEYEAVSRKVAEEVGLNYMDKSTFEAHRLMYWPSCCSDSEFVFRQGGVEPLNVDRTLARYADWRNTFLWPKVPGEASEERRDRSDKMEDPRGKTGIVGAFCRTFSISEAIDEFLPEVYEATGDPNRYTYTRGTSNNGAVIYDDDTFLFSHHGTDPCGGREVNAFDLVRIHLYGQLDERAKPDTPVQKLPSFKAFEEALMQRPDVAEAVYRERGETALSGFSIVDSYSIEDDSQDAIKSFSGRIKGEVLTTEMVQSLLSLFGIKTRLNAITGRVWLSGYTDTWSRANAENLLPVHLTDFLRRSGVKYASKNEIADRLDIISEEAQFNPVVDMLTETHWDGTDRIETLLSVWGIEDSFSGLLVRKWLLQCIAMALNDEDNPVGAEGVLVLQGPQGVGKTSALRRLIPLRGMFREGSQLDLNNKDTIIQSLACWVCELGELDRTTAKDSAGLKAFLTDATTRYRAPYARKEVLRPRMTSFCGSVNVTDYLVDVTGNRRFWTVETKAIDQDRLFSSEMGEEWYRQLWAQVYLEYLQSPDGFRLNGAERAELERKNSSYLKALDGELELAELLNWELPEEQWGEYSAAQVSALLKVSGTAIAARRLGRVLAKLSVHDARVSKRKLRGRMVYRLPILGSEESGALPL